MPEQDQINDKMAGQSSDEQTASPERATPLMSEYQAEYSGKSQGRLNRYKDFVTPESGWITFLFFELYNLLLSGLGSVLGYGARVVFLKLFLGRLSSGVVLGRNLTIRGPKFISLGKRAIVEDYSALDVRGPDPEASLPAISIGDHCFIGRHSTLISRGAPIVFDRAVNISSYCRIASHHGVYIGESTLISAYVYIGPGNHVVGPADTPIINQGMEEASGVFIGQNVWIGAKVTILDGVTVGNNAVIGAHSLVREDVPENAIVAGTPAKILRFREPNETQPK